jgi:hypothetical protein
LYNYKDERDYSNFIHQIVNDFPALSDESGKLSYLIREIDDLSDSSEGSISWVKEIA